MKRNLEKDQPAKSLDERCDDLTRELSRAQRGFERVAYCVFGVFAALGLLSPLFGDDTASGKVLWVGSCVELAVFIAWTFRAQADRAYRRDMVRSLSLESDIRIVPAMIDARESFSGDDQRSNLALDALLRLLPQVQPEHNGLLTTEQMESLCRTLDVPYSIQKSESRRRFPARRDLFGPPDMDRYVEFAVAILQALRHIGDARALKTVEQLAAKPAITDWQQRIQTAATECLPELCKRVEAEQITQTLLRPASNDYSDGSGLLRPAGLSLEEELLRPSE